MQAMQTVARMLNGSVNWNSASKPCRWDTSSWEGVSCAEDQVVAVDLSGYHLGGAIWGGSIGVLGTYPVVVAQWRWVCSRRWRP